MTSTPAPTPIIVRLTKNLHWAERAFFVLLVIGTTLAYLKIDTSVLGSSLIGLALVFFLYAYKPLDIIRNENEPLGFPDLLALTILPKIIWISSAISTLGILFYLLDLGNDGYKNMLMIGGAIIGVAVFLLIILLASRVKNVQIIIPILFRAVPLLLIDLYILYK